MSIVIRASGYTVRRAEDVPPVPCPCGQSTRIVTAADGLGCSFHVTEIRDSVRHYHKTTAEVYYILEGTGRMELDSETVDIEPGMVITISAGIRHRLVSPVGVRTVVVGVPAFDPADEFFD
jgi:mannose-6-phosphate isomerase-like protein (cupin superfamily)